jgi:predicted ATPase
MSQCSCTEPHPRRRIVLTGGPGAGKTAILELVRRAFCAHMRILPETAGILFGGGFPRGDSALLRRAGQRAIFFTQRELEATADGTDAAIVLCDRGTVDAVAYWPGPEDFWTAVGTTLEQQLARYDAVIHLRTPRPESGYNRNNPLRIETAAEAAAIDDRILQAWEHHPRRFVIDATPDFLVKTSRALEVLRAELPDCCRAHATVTSLTAPGSIQPY